MFSAHARAARRSKINFVLSRNPRAFFFLVDGVFLWFVAHVCMCPFLGASDHFAGMCRLGIFVASGDGRTHDELAETGRSK